MLTLPQPPGLRSSRMGPKHHVRKSRQLKGLRMSPSLLGVGFDIGDE